MATMMERISLPTIAQQTEANTVCRGSSGSWLLTRLTRCCCWRPLSPHQQQPELPFAFCPILSRSSSSVGQGSSNKCLCVVVKYRSKWCAGWSPVNASLLTITSVRCPLCLSLGQCLSVCLLGLIVIPWQLSQLTAASPSIQVMPVIYFSLILDPSLIKLSLEVSCCFCFWASLTELSFCAGRDRDKHCNSASP